MFVLGFSLFVTTPIFATIDNHTLTGYDQKSTIQIEFDNNQLIRYSLEFLDGDSKQINLTQIDPKFKIKDDRFFVIDRANGLFIIGKNIEDKKWIIISKIKLDSEKITKRWIIDIEPTKKITGQRDLLAENDNKSSLITENSFKKSQNLDKYKKIDEAERIHQEKLKRLESQNNKLSKTEMEASYSKYEEYKKTIFDRDDDRPKPIVDSKNQDDIGSMKLFLSLPKTVEHKQKLVYSVLVTDETRGKFESSYNSFVGNGIVDVIISSVIKNPLNVVLHESDGATDSNGLYSDSFIIPDRSTTKGKYILEISATKSIDGTILKESLQKNFFVNSVHQSDNTRPYSIIKDVLPIITMNQTIPILGNLISTIKIESSKINATHFKSNGGEIFYLALNNQTEYSKDGEYNKLEITALPYDTKNFDLTNFDTTHFKNSDDVFHRINDTGDIETWNGEEYIFAPNYTGYQKINHAQAQFFLKDTDIADYTVTKSEWHLDQI